MREEKIVQFVHFETILDSSKFIPKWEQFIRSVNSDVDVTLQQAEKNGVFRYIAQHRCGSGEFKFVFAKAGRSSRIPEVEIKAKQMGGYSTLQLEKAGEATAIETKVMICLTQSQADLHAFKQLSNHGKLNIYEAYFENCQYAYILEYFVKNQFVETLLSDLEKYDIAETGIYKVCTLQEA